VQAFRPACDEEETGETAETADTITTKRTNE
jgi:hypothetical protein